MTVMIESFFGLHPHVIRSGLWAKMKPGEKDLYVFLMAESERRCTREITTTDALVETKVGAAPRTLCNARKKLQEHGLIKYRCGQGNKYTYVICNPKTRQPYSGLPREPIRLPKKVRNETNPSGCSEKPESSAVEGVPLQVSGLPGIFQWSRSANLAGLVARFAALSSNFCYRRIRKTFCSWRLADDMHYYKHS